MTGLDGSTPAGTVMQIATGHYFACSALADGTAACWGKNADGQLGNGSQVQSDAPVTVLDSTGPGSTLSIFQGARGRTLPVVAPGAPTIVSASSATSSSLVVSWTAPSDNGGAAITNYVVQYRPVSATEWSTFNHEVSTAISITVTGLSTASSYEFQIAAVNTAGTGAFSSLSGAASTLAIAPRTPTNVSASSATRSSLVVSWTASSDDGGAAITDYVVQYRLTSANSWSTFTRTASTATSITVTGLSTSSWYVFKVAAVNSVDPGNFSDASIARSTLAPPGRPGRPEIGARTTSTMRISWGAAASNGSAITNYVVEYRKDTGAWRTFTRPTPSTALSMTVTGLTVGDSYTFRVSAVSAGGTSPTSAVSAVGLAATDPDAPESVIGKATKVAGQIAVTWTAADLNGAPGATYTISWLVGGKWTTPVTATGFAYTIAKLKPGTYSVRVTATTVEGSATATKTGIVLANKSPLAALTGGGPSLLFG